MKKITMPFMLMAAVAVAGCQKEGTPVGEADDGKDAGVTLSLQNVTRAPSGEEEGENHENTVKTLEVYVFNSDGSQDKRLGQSDFGKEDGNGYYKTQDVSGSVNLIVTSGTGKTFVAVVNMELGPLATGEKLAKLREKLAVAEFKASAGGSDHNSRDKRTAKGFDMTGEKTSVTIEEGVKGQKVHIAVDRLSSKMPVPTFKNGAGYTTVTLDAAEIEKVWGKDSGIKPSDITFEANGYTMINGISKSHLYFIGNANGDDTVTPWTVDHATWVAGKSYLGSSFNQTGFYTNNYGGYNAGADWFLAVTNTDPIYFYENQPGKITVDGQTGYNPKDVYAMMLKGTLKVAGQTGKDAVRYWRLDIHHEDDYHVLRNCVYRLNVKNIHTAGHATPKDAEDDKKVIPGRDESEAEIEITVNDWRVNFYDYDV